MLRCRRVRRRRAHSERRLKAVPCAALFTCVSAGCWAVCCLIAVNYYDSYTLDQTFKDLLRLATPGWLPISTLPGLCTSSANLSLLSFKSSQAHSFHPIRGLLELQIPPFSAYQYTFQLFQEGGD
jgi:hypothetical protein